jgi:hypothetical protein
MKKMMIGVLVSSLLAATTPLYAESASITGPALSPESVRASIERAIVMVDTGAPAPTPARHPLSVSVQRQFASTSASPTSAGDAQAVPAVGGGGGGHSLATILTLIGTAVSVGGAIYYMKIIKKATSQPPSN